MRQRYVEELPKFKSKRIDWKTMFSELVNSNHAAIELEVDGHSEARNRYTACHAAIKMFGHEDDLEVRVRKNKVYITNKRVVPQK